MVGLGRHRCRKERRGTAACPSGMVIMAMALGAAHPPGTKDMLFSWQQPALPPHQQHPMRPQARRAGAAPPSAASLTSRLARRPRLARGRLRRLQECLASRDRHWQRPRWRGTRSARLAAPEAATRAHSCRSGSSTAGRMRRQATAQLQIPRSRCPLLPSSKGHPGSAERRGAGPAQCLAERQSPRALPATSTELPSLGGGEGVSWVGSTGGGCCSASSMAVQKGFAQGGALSAWPPFQQVLACGLSSQLSGI
mmetsp:Transcript_101885/g.273527  ORF Transcript_101885/g.273527 Transcript_101885/m.273527 type:complete len:253 (+) Transcript_101885:1739-2497(+)